MGPMRTAALGAALLAAGAAARADTAPAAFVDILAEMHPGYGSFVREVRRGATHLHPQGHVAGLVRPGGSDPRDPRDAPRSGAGVRNDIIVYDDTFGGAASGAWRRLIVDHEYFHARHLAHGAPAPAVDFGDERVNGHYYEALAWGYNLERIVQRSYPGLSLAERRLVEERYRGHREAFERWLRATQRPAWEHYGKFFDVSTPGAAAR